MREMRVNALVALAAEAEQYRMCFQGVESRYRQMVDLLSQSSSDEVCDLGPLARDCVNSACAAQDAFQSLNRAAIAVVNDLSRETDDPTPAA